MVEYIARRFFLTIPTLLGVSIILFVLVRVLPGDAALVKAGEALTGGTDEATLTAMRQAMGLDKPIAVQYGLWLGDLLRGDLGVSLRSGEKTLGELVTRLPVTLELTIGSALVSVITGLLLGVVSAVYQDRS
ncbi:MAG: ABC transporter permease, partial [Chloroflexota bacterium]